VKEEGETQTGGLGDLGTWRRGDGLIGINQKEKINWNEIPMISESPTEMNIFSGVFHLANEKQIINR